MASMKLIEEIDDLHMQFQFDATYEKMNGLMDKHHHSSESGEFSMELQSRWARTLYYYGMFVASSKERKHVFERGLTVSHKLCQGSNHNFGYGHLWYGVLLGTVSKASGYRRQLEKCSEIGFHLKKASELLPDCFDSQHGYGRFQYEIADLSGMLRTFLKWASSSHKLPHCTYEEALHHFLKAETQCPGFFSMNSLYIGKCYLQLKQQENAVPYLIAAANWKVQFADDENARKEARSLLLHLGVKDFDE